MQVAARTFRKGQDGASRNADQKVALTKEDEAEILLASTTVADTTFADPHFRKMLNINNSSKNLKFYGLFFSTATFIPNDAVATCAVGRQSPIC